LIAERGTSTVGFVLVTLTAGYQGWKSAERVAELQDLSVLPVERNRGTGTALLDAVEAELQELKIAEFRLRVLTANVEARRLYERRGMTPAFEVLVGRVGRERDRPD
jgi:ribosomal protein S18 acetylase RimI-like enzyme